MSSKILENDLHVFVVSWHTQEIIAYRDLKTDELKWGDEDKIEQVGYVAVFTRMEEDLDNKVTGGWKIIDVSCFFSLWLRAGLSLGGWLVCFGLLNVSCSPEQMARRAG